MGVLSRKVLPTCGALCYFYPGLRARSRQPVKRYKKILAEIFPRTQDEEPNDRRIGKLCEYAAKNPLRVPKITVYLEQRIYKELRAEQYGFAKVVMLIHRGLLVSCKGQIAHCSALRASATDATIYQSSEIVSIHIQSLDQTTKAAHIITRPKSAIDILRQIFSYISYECFQHILESCQIFLQGLVPKGQDCSPSDLLGRRWMLHVGEYNGLCMVNLVAFGMGLTLWFFLPRQHGVRVGMSCVRLYVTAPGRGAGCGKPYFPSS
ncbi:uncharacterized protein LOC119295267 isoform X3 [Triticum dicoccoides]|uniref:uncharacterized protein LOC119295267 isoform X3 n=1 Tax=Triticum dicoccoides TaxID=85692 RepID=UPI00188F9210|nr:uncharacterized protein LOC119295267 isoform X3 [Triticum dicoccoides]